ncbi:unnamed protein product [Lactuca saligna]|uniref:Uncharacterized protein n=1 Tax=Lactuca saligna TaxID=75948 RepID=A0AA35Z920_LACSI|nr:unnamed protein product [Lactuca saligna]
MGDLEFAKAHNSAIFLEDPPAAHSDLKTLWMRNAEVKKNDRGEKFLETTIEDKKRLVQKASSENLFKLRTDLSTSWKLKSIKLRKFWNIWDTKELFLLQSKLLPPCWKLLAHVFVSCVSGWRSGANKISLANTGAIVALAAEDNREEAADKCMPIEDEYTHNSPSEPVVEEIHHSPTACVADEHDHQKASDSISSRGDDDDDLYEDVEYLKEIDFTGINDDIPTNIEFDFGDEDFDPFLDTPSSHANKVNEVASLATKTRSEGNSLKILLTSSKPLEITASQGYLNLRLPIPPLEQANLLCEKCSSNYLNNHYNHCSLSFKTD